jgi:NDP-sugar pyrophosphorylase family protein
MRAFLAFHQRRGSQATVLLNRVDDPTRFGVVSLEKNGRIGKFVEKPKTKAYGNLINAGAYILESDWIEGIPAGQVVSVERDTFPAALKKKTPMYGYPMIGYWNDIGTPKTYLQAQQDLFDKKLFRKRGHVLVSSSASIAKTARMEGFVCCGENVVVGPEAFLKNCVIMNGAKIEKGVAIEGSVIGRNCIVMEFSKIGEGTMLGDKTVLPPYTQC